MKNDCYNWQLLMLHIARFVISFIVSLSKDKEHFYCLVVDDTMLERPRSKKAELLTRLYNHVSGKTIKGYCNLALGWTDGISFIPVLNHLIASSKGANTIKGAYRTLDKRLSSAIRRKIALMRKPDVLISMCKRALRFIPASHILMDSWCFSDELISQL